MPCCSRATRRARPRRSRRCWRRASNSPLAHLGLGDIARLQQRHEEAIARYEQALAFDADLHPAAIRRADSLARSGRVEEAVSGLVERASRYPEAGYLKVAIATLLSQQKKHAEALAWWRDAAALLPNDANAQAGFALSLDLAGEHEAALQQAQRVPVDGPRQSGLALLRARAALRGGEPAEALRALESLDESQWQESPIAARRRWKLAGTCPRCAGAVDGSSARLRTHPAQRSATVAGIARAR